MPLLWCQNLLLRSDCRRPPLHYVHSEVQTLSSAWENYEEAAVCFTHRGSRPRRMTHNQLTLLGLSSCLEILILSFSTSQSQRSEVSPLTHLPSGCPQPRKSQDSAGSPFLAGGWRRPEGPAGARPKHSWKFYLAWKRGKLRGEKPLWCPLVTLKQLQDFISPRMQREVFWRSQAWERSSRLHFGWIVVVCARCLGGKGIGRCWGSGHFTSKGLVDREPIAGVGLAWGRLSLVLSWLS